MCPFSDPDFGFMVQFVTDDKQYGAQEAGYSD